jgi:hypothetical protein
LAGDKQRSSPFTCYGCARRVQTLLQGGSDKSGILKIFLENLTAQLKVIQFYKTKKQLTEARIENQDIQ